MVQPLSVFCRTDVDTITFPQDLILQRFVPLRLPFRQSGLRCVAVQSVQLTQAPVRD